MMATEEDAYVFEGEEEEDLMESESEGEEEEEEEVEQLEEIRPPMFISWKGPDGITAHGIVCIDDGILRLKNRCQFDDCPICYNPPTTHGNHKICCLPCGHMYGFSCIKKWLLQSNSSGKCPQCNALCTIQDAILLQSSSIGKCPQCNTLCTIQDAILLFPPPLCVTAHQKASLAAFFPLTRQGFLEFKEYEYSRLYDALLLQAHDLRHSNIVVRKHNDLVDRSRELTRQSDNFLTRAEELEERAESSGLADALRRRASPLKPRIDALGRRTDALKRLISALRRRSDALGRRAVAYESRLRFFAQMYKEQRKTKKKMQASGTIEVPKEEPVEDVAVEHEEEKVED